MTMKELAKMAGVSSAAVSRYLNGGPLSQEKRERIKAMIEQTGYQPDPAAQMLRTRSTDQIGLIIPKVNSHAASRVVAGAASVLAQEGYFALLASTDDDPEKEITYLNLFQSRSVAGIILMASVMTPRHEEVMRTSPVPIVVNGQKFRQVPCVYHDDHGAAYEIASRMIARGRRKLGYIGVTEADVAVGLNRRRGVQAAMKDSGMDPEHLAIATSPSFSIDGGRAAMERLLELRPGLDGVICATDQIAFGAMEVLKEKGFRLPEEISIAGMDDNWASRHVSPTLTTAHFYYKTSGETAARLLLDMIRTKQQPGPIQQTMLGYTIQERESI